jgi:cyclic pyranopterin monophosphate synthase
MGKLSHTNEKGKANMVNVANKPNQIRIAEAEGFITLNEETLALIEENQMKKGDVLTIAEIAGIQGAKRTSELIPLCHPLQITKVDVSTMIESNGVRIKSSVICVGQTGVEMEALNGVSIALLTVYDMCKAVDKGMIISNVRLLKKTKQDIL